jgi:prophage antirepressor-like protein
MNNNTTIKLFENCQIRTVWNEDEEEWYFSLVDIAKEHFHNS